MRKKVLALYAFMLLGIVTVSTCQPMGEREQFSRSEDPPYADPEPDSENFEGEIRDEGTKTKVHWLTFFGNQTVGGVRKEQDDSRSKLDLADIQSLKVIDSSYESKRYPTKQFAKIEVTSKGGATEMLLIPQGLVICARSKDGDVKKSWYIDKVDEIVVESGTIPGIDEIAAPPSAIRKEIIEERIQELEKPLVAEKNQYENKVVKIVGQDDVGEKKGIMESFNDIISSVIAFFKSIYNTIKRAIF